MNDDILTEDSPDDYGTGDPVAEDPWAGEEQAWRSMPLIALAMAIAGAVTFVAFKPAFYAASVSTLGVALFVWALREPLRGDMAAQAIVMAFFTPVAAWVLPNLWLVYFVMLAWVPLFSGRFERIAGVYLFSLMLLPGLDTTFEPGGLKLFDVSIHDALALGATFAIARDPRKSRVAAADDVRVGLLLLILVFALARETSVTHFLRTTINVTLDYGLPYYILSRGLGAVGAMRAAMRWLAGAASGVAGLLAFEVWYHWPLYNELYSRHGVPTLILVKTRGAMMRAGGPFTEPTSMALVMAMCLFALWLLRRDFRTGTLHALLCAVTFVGLSAPQSRNAWIGFGLAIVLADIFTGRWSALVRKLVPAAAAIGLVMLVAGTSPEWSESVGLSGQGSVTADYRRALLERGSEEFWKSPIVGYSSHELERRLNDMRQGEGIIDYVNSYLWFGLVAGMCGVAVLVANLFVPLAQLWSRRWRLFGIGASAPAAFVFGCIGMLAMTLFFTSFGARPTVLAFGFMGLSAALRAASRRAWSEEDDMDPAQSGTGYRFGVPHGTLPFPGSTNG